MPIRNCCSRRQARKQAAVRTKVSSKTNRPMRDRKPRRRDRNVHWLLMDSTTLVRRCYCYYRWPENEAWATYAADSQKLWAMAMQTLDAGSDREQAVLAIMQAAVDMVFNQNSLYIQEDGQTAMRILTSDPAGRYGTLESSYYLLRCRQETWKYATELSIKMVV